MRLLGLAVAVALAGCNGSVTQQTSASASGAGGASASSSAQSSSSGPVNGACGYFVDNLCTADYYCDYGGCPSGDAVGVCKPRPTACDQNCTMVCGCNGIAYCNACVALLMGGQLVTTDTSCLQETYTATSLFTNIERLALFKVDNQKRCVRLILALEGGMSTGMTLPAGWIIETAEVTNTPTDCALVKGQWAPASDLSAPAIASSGVLEFPSGSTPPMDITVHGTLSFTPTDWVPASEDLSVDGLKLTP